MNNKKFIGVIISSFILMAMAFLISFAAADPFMKNYYASVVIDNNGSITIDEEVVMKYPRGYSVIFRDIIYDKNANSKYLGIDQSYLDLDSIRVRVYDSNQSEIFDSDFGKSSSDVRIGYSFHQDKDELGDRITCPPGLPSKCESIFVHVLGGMEKEMTFRYTYTINGAVTEFSDVSVLNWRLFNYFDTKVKSAEVDITLPANNFKTDDIYIFGHGLYAGNTEIISNEHVSLNQIKNIKQGEFIEFRLMMANGIVENVSENNKRSEAMKQSILYEEELMAKDANLLRTAYLVLLIGSIVFGIVMILLFIYVYFKYDREFKASFDGDYYRDLPADYSPAEMSYLYYFKKINDEDLTATILDLIRRKVLFLEVLGSISDKKPEFELVYNKSHNSHLKAHEAFLVDWFINQIGDGNKVSLKEIENYPKTNYSNAQSFRISSGLFVKKAIYEAEKNDFFDKDLDKTKPRLHSFVIIPIIYIFISLYIGFMFGFNTFRFSVFGIILAIIYSVYVSTFKRRSIQGNEEFVKWRAFRKFLLEFSQIKDYPIPGVIVWEHYLVYATSLKIADKVMEQLKIALPYNEANYASGTYLSYHYGMSNFYYGYMFSRVSSSMNVARYNTTQTIAAHTASNFSSGGGRGGGFSGGSSFGGGGGGFRSR